MKKNSYLKNILTRDLLEKEFEELKSSKAIGRKLGIAGDTISKYMEDFGLTPNKKIKYKCNEDVFSTDSESSFYLAGFIAADGCIMSSGGSKLLSIGLSNKDKAHLEKIRNALGAENPIRDYDVKTSKQN